ncbi:MAG: HD domain-containing protein [Candidatus Levybacteria bacterium]|nr:HD domain-containing protein [Candidatus Levybacteria bacterium]
MINKIPNNVLEIYKKIQDAGFEVYFVGGCVRNILMNLPAKDWDLTTNATPDQILKLFPEGFNDNVFGTVGIPIDKPVILGNKVTPESSTNKTINVVEITTFRTERGYIDRRHPESVDWGKTIEEDLSRRDFTINSIALKIDLNQSVIASKAKQSPDGIATSSSTLPQEDLLLESGARNDVTFELIDPFSGQKDIEFKTIRAVGDPNKRFKEDALRLMRAIRIATQLSFVIEEKTWNAIKADAELLSEISRERIRDELMMILASNFPYEGIMLLKNANLLQYIIPELLEGVNVSQERPGRHHKTDVFTHNVMSLKHCASTDPVVRFATLIHDTGKPRVQTLDENGLVIFHNHEIVSAKMAYEICERLHFSKKERGRVINLIRWHMFTVDEKITDAAVRRFIRRVGVENIKDLVDLRIGDRLGGGTQRAESWRLKLFKKRVEEQLQPAPFSINDLAVDGNDVIRILNIKPGPIIGKILQKLFEEVDEDLEKNNREYLEKRVKELGEKPF